MRKTIILLLICLMLAGCAKNEVTEVKETPVPTEVPIPEPTAAPTTEPENEEPKQEAPEAKDPLSLWAKDVQAAMPDAKISMNDKAIYVEYPFGDDIYNSVIENDHSSAYMLIWDQLIESNKKNSKAISDIAKKYGVEDPIVFSVISQSSDDKYMVFVDGELKKEIFEDITR